jgi:hypothetical protein
MFACRDGYIRAFEPSAWSDCGEPIKTYIKFGPIRLADDPRMDGIVESLAAEVGDYDPAFDEFVTGGFLSQMGWSLHVGDTGHEALNAPAFATGQWERGLSTISTPRAKGKYAMLKVSGSITESDLSWTAWTLERIFAEVSRRGRHREA